MNSFRGLPADYEINFNKKSHLNDSAALIEPTCLVGLNGSGKSNLLEVLAEIFFYLENYCSADRHTNHVISRFKNFPDFELQYFVSSKQLLQYLSEDQEVRAVISRLKDEVKVLIFVTKDSDHTQVKAFVDGQHYSLKNDPAALPTRVIGYSSGMNELISNPFIKIDFQYLSEMLEKRNNSTSSSLVMNRMFYLNYDSNKYITIANFLFDSDDFSMEGYDETSTPSDFGGINLRYLKTETGIQDLNFFTLNLRLEKSAETNANYLSSALNLVLEKFKACSTFYEANERETKTKSNKELTYKFWVNSATKAAFRNEFKTAYELYKAFYFLELLNLELVSKTTRDNILGANCDDQENLSEELPRFEKQKLKFYLSQIKLEKDDGVEIDYRKLSDGEHQLLQVIGSLLLMDKEGALFLYDEPETHFNPDWRSKFVQLINNSVDKSREQEIILTTHSPFIISDCKKENVYIFQRDSEGNVLPPINPEVKTFGTSVSILTDEIFGKSETVSNMSLSVIKDIRSEASNSLEDLEKAKRKIRKLGESPEKILLYSDLLTIEKNLKD
ncbi:MAG: restriction system-associated AAA family ATPase [Xanthomonadales bacterium]|nr:restriction system-associated AAA family ATPase [Xanthomonadales bacterium]